MTGMTSNTENGEPPPAYSLTSQEMILLELWRRTGVAEKSLDQSSESLTNLSRAYQSLSERLTELSEHTQSVEDTNGSLLEHNTELVDTNRALVDQNAALIKENGELREKLEAPAVAASRPRTRRPSAKAKS